MKIRDDDTLDTFIGAATGFPVNKHPGHAESSAEQRRRFRAAFEALPPGSLVEDVSVDAPPFSHTPDNRVAG